MFHSSLRLLLLTVGLWSSLWAGEAGLPFTRIFTPREMGGAHPQNWAVVQDARGFIYVGNGAGILEFDGVRWNLIETTHHTAVRGLALAPDGRIYVGGEGVIGYLEPDGVGRVQFHSLQDRLEDPAFTFSAVRGVFVLPQGIVFQVAEGFMVYSGGWVRILKAGAPLLRAFQVGGRLLFQSAGGGLQVLGDGGQATALAGTEALVKVTAILPMGGEALLIVTARSGLFRYDGRRLKPFGPARGAPLSLDTAYCGCRLGDGSFAIGTLHNGVFIVAGDGQVLLRLDRNLGLPDDGVTAVFQDAQSGLWLGLANGLARVDWPSPLTLFDARSGLRSFAWSLARHQGLLYAGTGHGIFALEARGPAPRFREVQGAPGQCLGLASSAGSLLATSSTEGVLEVRGDRAVRIPTRFMATSCLLPSRSDPDRVWVGGAAGVGSIRKDRRTGRWVDEGLLEGVKADIFRMAECSDGELWGASRAFGLVRIQVDRSRQVRSCVLYGTKDGLPAGGYLHIAEFQGRLLVGGNDGIYALDPVLGRFQLDPALKPLFPDGPRAVELIRPGPGGALWMHALGAGAKVKEVGAALPEGGRVRWEPAPFQRIAEQDFADILPESDGIVWFSGIDQLVRFDPRVAPRDGGPGQVRIRQVSLPGGQVLSGGWPLAPGAPPRPPYPYAHRSMRFTYALPAFGLSGGTRYQVRLQGYDRDWSDWTDEPFKDFTNLPAGVYRFRVRAKDSLGRLAMEDAYAFEILPPFYGTLWAKLGYLLLGAGLLWGLSHLRTRLLLQRNRALEQRIRAATAELHQANGELQDLNQQKNQFLEIVSHDLKNPLQNIALTAGLLEAEQDLAAIHELGRTIRSESSRMGELIGRLLDISAIEAGTVRAEPEAFPLGSIASLVAGRFRPRAQSKGIRIQTLIEAEAGVYADLRFTMEILDNLLSNALKFSPPGSEVTVQVQGHGDRVHLRVMDQGPGFTAADRQALFGRFTRLSARPTGGEGSTGLGLSIVKHMVDAMGCTITLEGELGQGASFRIDLPAASV